ncbi:hypothetical protein B484DRAFT_449042 [Ochromonadaceae sp. CCMP2298]|nr:hypothetical protein B484DRAFT_449042 [Ochromonadaceae sp. CCMP2298]
MLCLATLCRHLVLLALLLLHSPAFATDAMADLSNKCVGFLGCGKISSAVCRGYAGASGASRPGKILVSQRSAEKSQALAAAYPGLVTIASNEEVVAQSDIVFIGLLPGVARELLPTLPFDDKKLVVSMMAAVDLAETLALVRVAPERLVRTVPLPAAANRSGPVLVHPPNQELEAVLRVVGTPVVCVQEAEMKPMVSLTGHISSFFELMNATQDFIVENGVDPVTARQFVTAFYSSCASGAEMSTEKLEDMAEEAATPGGLNEQSWRQLKTTQHFQLHKQSMQAILDRLQGKK